MSYRDIYRGPELKDAYDKLLLWQAKTRAQKKAAYTAVAKAANQRAKAERTDGFILPFNGSSTTVYLETRVLNATQSGVGSSTASTVKGLVDDRFVIDLPTTAGTQSLRVPKFQFAKIIASERTETATTESPSRKTDTPYKRHRSNNVSCPFGRKSASDNYAAAVAEIRAKTAFETFENTVGNRIGFIPEG